MGVTAAQFTVMLALAGGDKHGYAIMTASRDLPGPRMGPGTLYRSIRQLADAKWIVEVDAPVVDGAGPPPARDGGAGSERRRYYRLTDAGRAVAIDEAAALSAVVAYARRAGLLPGSVASGAVS